MDKKNFDVEFAEGRLKITFAEDNMLQVPRSSAILSYLFYSKSSSFYASITGSAPNTLCCDSVGLAIISGKETQCPLTAKTAVLFINKLKENNLISLEEEAFALTKIQAAKTEEQDARYENFVTNHVKTFTGEKNKKLVGFFRTTHMDFLRYRSMESIDRYVFDHPHSRSAKVYNNLNVKKR